MSSYHEHTARAKSVLSAPPLEAMMLFTLRCVGDDDNIYIKKNKVKVQPREEEV